MGKVKRGVYQPDPASADIYDELYAEYVTLHDYFGRGSNEVMHRLRALRDRVLGAHADDDPDDGDTTSAALEDETGGA
jgi:L-ribulokinase